MSETLIVHINAGVATNGTAIRNFIANTLKGGSWVATFKLFNRRSIPQNRYYFILIGMVRDRMIELGNDVDSNIVHAYFKDRFNSIEIVAADGLNIGSVGGSTAKLSKQDFADYIEKIREFSASVLDRYLPDPNEQTTLIK